MFKDDLSGIAWLLVSQVADSGEEIQILDQ